MDALLKAGANINVLRRFLNSAVTHGNLQEIEFLASLGLRDINGVALAAAQQTLANVGASSVRKNFQAIIAKLQSIQ